ncbi:MAG: pyrroline-5-carboxylate reductase [Bacteroidetes bacterium GWF2_42_66]|nr:MAG: pyrroline-5-carboxylate reductase [Bacteroidetes bacterium GWA2_42_15]OFX99509.1 MAG: pyrroline-5-carboxylate reductase [Bacteroidetes bacterium GWE2_42_39]OFY40482.1 MAG: pyrroline-5-carboxylate reductase [Bacteroidetes bacterium GWF2_42_66]HBL76937.1 pyrroline-5-carboxylate reductase [Prolixibacteraceae bacterium]HCR90827.1 pyrroline-5-carboxylate reductase [Prolixibacteraceae bacterium]
MKIEKIAIIGAGNMGGAILNGLLKSGYINASSIAISDPRKNILEEFVSMGVHTFQANVDAARSAELILLAVKPYHVKNVVAEIKPVFKGNEIIVSIAAGVTIAELEGLIGKDAKIFRVMPNTAISIQESMTCISANKAAEESLQVVKEMFDHLGQAVIINEELMSASTVLASCGTAFALRYVRAAMQGGVEMGFGAEMAQFITAQTVKGAVQLIMNTGHHPEREIDKVTTPRGITITGLNEMEHKGFSSSVIQGLLASYNKIEK